MYANTRPPSLEDASEVFAGAHSLEERLERLISLFDFYERGAPYIEADFQERQLPMVQEWEAHMRATIKTSWYQYHRVREYRRRKRMSHLRRLLRGGRTETGRWSLLGNPVDKGMKNTGLSENEYSRDLGHGPRSQPGCSCESLSLVWGAAPSSP